MAGSCLFLLGPSSLFPEAQVGSDLGAQAGDGLIFHPPWRVGCAAARAEGGRGSRPARKTLPWTSEVGPDGSRTGTHSSITGMACSIQQEHAGQFSEQGAHLCSEGHGYQRAASMDLRWTGSFRGEEFKRGRPFAAQATPTVLGQNDGWAGARHLGEERIRHLRL